MTTRSATVILLAARACAADPAVEGKERGLTVRTADGWVRVQAEAERRFHVAAGPGAPQAGAGAGASAGTTILHTGAAVSRSW